MIMPQRITAIFLCFFLWIVSMKAQDSLLYQRITIPPTRCSLDDALKIIAQKSGLSFSYNSDLLDKKKEILLEAANLSLFDLLNTLFTDPSLSYSVIGRHLVIYRPYRAQAINPESRTDSVYFFLINGKVMDSETRMPIGFSTVYLVGKTTGTISNEEGEFQLKLSYEDLPEILSISCMGYKNFSAPVSQLVNTTNAYFLETDIVPIQEVIIRRLSPVLLLETATTKIRENYPREPAVLTSFYRETVQRGSQYTMVSEAILHHFKAGYQNLIPDRVKIIKGRKNESINPSDSVLLKLKAGLNTMILLDVVKNIPDFLTGKQSGYYHYKLTDIVVEDGRDHYAIEFSPRADSPDEVIYSGRIIIDIQDMAFKWIEFHVSPELLVRATDQFIIRKPSNMIVKALKANYKVAFRKTGNNYYLHLIQCETGFRIRQRKQLSGSNYFTRLEMVVLDMDTVNVSRFTQRESAKALEFFTDQIGEYDESFWGEYNFIAPDESLENALSRLRKITSKEQ
jgi:hypothetical protein